MRSREEEEKGEVVEEIARELVADHMELVEDYLHKTQTGPDGYLRRAALSHLRGDVERGGAGVTDDDLVRAFDKVREEEFDKVREEESES